MKDGLCGQHWPGNQDTCHVFAHLFLSLTDGKCLNSAGFRSLNSFVGLLISFLFLSSLIEYQCQ